MQNLHNIECRKPMSNYKSVPYLGYSASGTKYYATRRHDGKGWRFALTASSQVGEPPYFYVRTLAEASTKLETIKGE